MVGPGHPGKAAPRQQGPAPGAGNCVDAQSPRSRRSGSGLGPGRDFAAALTRDGRCSRRVPVAGSGRRQSLPAERFVRKMARCECKSSIAEPPVTSGRGQAVRSDIASCSTDFHTVKLRSFCSSSRCCHRVTFAGDARIERRGRSRDRDFRRAAYQAYIGRRCRSSSSSTASQVEVQQVDLQSARRRGCRARMTQHRSSRSGEISEGTLGFFTRGAGKKTSASWISRTSCRRTASISAWSRRAMRPWTARGRIYALPHDVHPVMLA